MKRTFGLSCLFAAALLLAAPARAEIPDIYKTVNRVTWVVTNIDVTRPAWAAMGMTDIQEFPNVALSVTYKGKPSIVHAWQVTGHIGNLTVDMIQPAEGQLNAYTHFLNKHGDGIFSIVHEVTGEAAMNAEIARMKAMGVEVLQQTRMPKQDASFTYFDTEAEGKYSLGLVWRPGGMAAADTGSAGRPAIVQHFGFVVRDMPPVSAYWAKLGFPALKIDHIAARPDSTYRGKQLLLPHYESLQQFNQFGYFWAAAPNVPANIYGDYLNGPRKREGIQHIALLVPDLAKAVAAHEKLGYPVVQFTTWGVAGKPGSGAHAYMDTDRVGGISAELYRPHP